MKTGPRHFGHGTPTYKSWRAMRSRCLLSCHPAYANYGGRGIVICDRWNSFQNFLADMGERPAGTEIDRIDVDGNYEPGNCRWADRKVNANNRRNNVFLTVRGERLSVQQWSKKTGIGHTTMLRRIELGWPDEAIVTLPPNRGLRLSQRMEQP